jgi:hypothetical protein
MKTPNSDKAWTILIERKADRRENRTAFIAALIYEKVRDANRDDQITAFQAEQFAVELVRLAGRIKAEAEAACSYERTPAQEAADEKNQARFAAIAEALGFEASTGGDPRGPCARLIDPDDRKGDGWGEGFAVYA